jgi:hypothetical protein
VGNRFLHTSADVAQVALDLGGETRLSVLAVGCDEVLAEGNPLTCVAGLDVGRLRFVMQAVGEFAGVLIGFHRSEHGAVVTRGGVIDPDVAYFGEGHDRNVGPHLGFQGIVGVRNWCEQAGGDCESSETAFHW